ncbi:MAG: alanine--tRNA ligase [Thermoplasmatota archaeon]
MLSEKDMKKRVKDEASSDPARFFPTVRMRELGLERSRCPKCGTYYWSADPGRETCGEPMCEGGYSFIGRENCAHEMDFIEVWKRFSDLFRKRGYTPIARYPSISRWNPTSEFTLASITDFQPYVVRGAVKPPANPLVVPQTCLRFNDVDNVGITGRHNTGFIMIGQHAFVPEEEFDQPRYFDDIHAWLIEGMGIPLKDLVYHEDAWAGGGNFGCSLEFFSKGLEIGNQVYTMYERVGDELKGLDIRVLDMGMGQERPAWFSHGTPTAYEPNFPTVMRRLFSIAGIKKTPEMQRMLVNFYPYSALLNMDEVEDIDRIWKEIADRTDADIKTLKDIVQVHAGLYSIADHSRALLFALSDGGLPSNSGGGYNLRLIFRRAQDFIDGYGWEIDLGEVARWHAEYLVPQFPEMLEAVPEVQEILAHELRKHRANKQKALSTVERLRAREREGRGVAMEDLLTLYDSQGITPDLLVSSGLNVSVPSDFYRKVSELHDREPAQAQTGKDQIIPFIDLPPTEVLYYDDYLMLEFEGRIADISDDNVVLDRTGFYPTSGGQLHDIGHLSGPTEAEVVEVFKQDHLIVHKVNGDLSLWKPGATVKGKIDRERRRQLAQHHTTTHIINGVARSILGNHIWQAGAEKTEEKGRLDITHYETLDKAQLESIERMANKIIDQALEVRSMILPRNEAEERYGFRLYQGGAVPGEKLRIISIEGLDTEACGGTHLKNTSEAVRITITGTKKIQDGILRLEYVAGRRAKEMYEMDLRDLRSIMELVGIDDPGTLVTRCEEIFELWKKLRKLSSKIRSMDPVRKVEAMDEISAGMEDNGAVKSLDHWKKLGSLEEVPGSLSGPDPDVSRPQEYLHQASSVFKVQKQQLWRTTVRFFKETDAWLKELQLNKV